MKPLTRLIVPSIDKQCMFQAEIKEHIDTIMFYNIYHKIEDSVYFKTKMVHNVASLICSLSKKV